jgi:hypothetical protein
MPSGGQNRRLKGMRLKAVFDHNPSAADQSLMN